MSLNYLGERYRTFKGVEYIRFRKEKYWPYFIFKISSRPICVYVCFTKFNPLALGL